MNPAPRSTHRTTTAPRRHRVAMVIQRFRPAFTGQGVQVEQLCRGLAAAGTSSVVLTAVRGEPGGIERCEGYDIRRLRVDLVPGSRNRIRLWAPIFGLRVLAALLRARPQVVHVHGPTDGLIGTYWYRRLTGAPAVAEMTLLGDDDPLAIRDRTGPGAGLRWRAFRGFDRWVAMSEAFLPACRAAGLPSDRVAVIPQAVDTERFRPVRAAERAEARSRFGLAASAPVGVFVGAVSHRKGVDVLLEAWRAIVSARPDARLLVVGGPPGGAPEEADLALVQRVREGGEPGVVAVGHLDRPEEALRAADLFLFPSRREGFGSVIIEAMAGGLACVVSELPGITDFVLRGREGDLGRIVQQEDPEQLARAALELFADPQERARLGARGREAAEARFALPVIVGRYLQLYSDVLRERGATASR